MKKLITFTVMLLCFCIAQAAILGDVNQDNKVDIEDVNEIINTILIDETTPLTDVTGDGITDVEDLNLVINIILETPVEPLPTHYVVNGVEFDMVNVEGGTFNMGATSEQGSDAQEWEYPVHQVTLSNYQMGVTEVTQELWIAVMGTNPSKFTGNTQRPVEYVRWTECEEFINKLNELTSAHFRLPTEAEWEYAARGGNKSKGYKYAGSTSLGSVAWYTYNSSSATHPVATKSPNELGLYDMSGNVWEWCNDWYEQPYPTDEPVTDPTGPASSEWNCKVYRGGGWNSDAASCRVSNRANGSYNGFFTRYNHLGLRLAQ